MAERNILPDCCEDWILEYGRHYRVGESFACVECANGWQKASTGRYKRADDGRVFVGTSGAEVVALGSADGAVLWRTSVLGAVGSAPLVCGEYLYVGDLAKNLYALASPTGETVWQAETPGRVRCTPVAAPGRIIVLSEDRSIVGFREQR